MANVILKVSVPAEVKRHLSAEAARRGLTTNDYVAKLVSGELASPVRPEWSEAQWMTMLSGMRQALGAPTTDSKPTPRRRPAVPKGRKGAA